MNNAWRQIWIISFAALGVWVAALVIARAVPDALAQAVEPPAAAIPADEGPVDEGPPVGAPVTAREEVPPELRQSADNNVSFPVDI